MKGFGITNRESYDSFGIKSEFQLIYFNLVKARNLI